MIWLKERTLSEKRVLYAEDEFTNRKLLEIKLKNHGISCDLAQDGLKAVELFTQNKYDLVILDQYMPGLNGDQVARKIREINPDIPLIAITSDDGEIQTLNEADSMKFSLSLCVANIISIQLKIIYNLVSL